MSEYDSSPWDPTHPLPPWDPIHGPPAPVAIYVDVAVMTRGRYELNCKSIAQNLASIRGLPDLKMLGLPRNVLTWDAEQLGTWLDALGLGELVPNFQSHNVDGGTVFLLTEEHLRELGFGLVGDRLYFVEVRACKQAQTACRPRARASPDQTKPRARATVAAPPRAPLVLRSSLRSP